MLERRYFELRQDQDGRRLSGVAVRYGDVARLPWGLEKFTVGAFGDVGKADAILNVQHNRDRPLARTGGGGLVLEDSAESLRVTAELPQTRDADDALELVRKGILRGLSVEFTPTRERQDQRTRIIQRAQLSGLGLVDRPAYRESAVAARAEVREDGEGLSGSFLYDVATVVSDRAEERQARGVRKSKVSPGAFDFTLADDSREVQLLFGRSYDRPLASRHAGSLVLTDTPTALTFSVDRLPDTSYVRDFRAQLQSGAASFGVVPLYRIPPADVVPDAVIVEQEEGGVPGVLVETIRQAILTALSITTRAPRGNPGVVIPEQQRRRRALWLLR